MLANDLDVSLLYNHIIRTPSLGTTYPKLEDGQKTIDLVDDVKLSLGSVGVELCGYLVTMEKAVSENSGMYQYGFRFYGSNHVIYRANGSTTIDGSPGVNDLVKLVVATE